MTVSLTIENDAELRTYIKECIKNQVISFAREDFFEVIKEELTRKTKGLDSHNWEHLRREAIKKVVREQLEQHYNIESYNREFIRPFVEERLDSIIGGDNQKLFEAAVNRMVTEKIQALLKGKI
jgi:hypothetical protein